jgi:hypothetical protein
VFEKQAVQSIKNILIVCFVAAAAAFKTSSKEKKRK